MPEGKMLTCSELSVRSSDVKGNSYVGGIAGIYYRVSIVEAVNTRVSGQSYVGGLFGRTVHASDKMIMYNCTVSGSADNIGGLAGWGRIEGGCVINGVVLGLTQNAKNVGGISGNPHSRWQKLGCGEDLD